jgi:hypothetical protein
VDRAYKSLMRMQPMCVRSSPVPIKFYFRKACERPGTGLARNWPVSVNASSRPEHRARHYLKKFLVEDSRATTHLQEAPTRGITRRRGPSDKTWSSTMSNISARIAFALLLAGTPSASFARMAGEAGSGNVPISGIPPGPANVGGLNNINVDPSGIGNAARVPSLPPPRLSVVPIPKFK